MSSQIHPTAIVSAKAQLGENVRIDAYAIIEDDVIIGDNTHICSYAYLADGARIGRDSKIFQGAVIATAPQDIKFDGLPTLAIIGDRTIIREFATIHRGTHATGETHVGNDCLIMAYSHIAHDGRIGNNIIMANASQLGGHVHIEDWVTLGGVTKVHQFCKIGCHAMVGADSMLVKDVPPYSLIGHIPPKVEGLNKIGLKRRGFSSETIAEIDKFYDIVYFGGLNMSAGIKAYLENNSPIPEVQHCIDFIQNSSRGVYR
jgi:UDP-N-acetylglucosamine acyltransferase